MKNRLWNLAVCLCGLLLLACSEKGSVAGTATDTENTIAGTVLLSDGSVAEGVLVRQVARRSVSSFRYLETATDSMGAFAFDSSLADTVSFEFRYANADSSDLEMQVVRNVAISSRPDSVKAKLGKASIVRGRLDYLADSLKLVGSHFFVFLDSTMFGADVFAPDSFEFLAPEGSFSLVVVPADSVASAKLLALGYADSVVVRKAPVSVSIGESLDVGDLRWCLSPVESIKTRILEGVALDEFGSPLKGVAVHVVSDLYGFGVTDSSAFVAQAVTGADGVWRVPSPAIDLVADSVRVEFRGRDSSGTSLAGVSAYVSKDALVSADDTLSLGAVVLSKASSFLGVAYLVLGTPTDSTVADTLCLAYSIRVGFKGTSRFTTVSSCDTVSMRDIPAEGQDLVFYSGDDIVVRNLKSGAFRLDDYVKIVSVGMPSNGTLKYQGFTYTPPTTAQSASETGTEGK